MIRHDYIFFYFGHISYIFFCNPPIRLRDDVGIVPYDGTEEFLTVLGADGDKIGTVLAVIIIFYAVGFSLGKVYKTNPFTKNRACQPMRPVPYQQ